MDGADHFNVPRPVPDRLLLTGRCPSLIHDRSVGNMQECTRKRNSGPVRFRQTQLVLLRRQEQGARALRLSPGLLLPREHD